MTLPKEVKIIVADDHAVLREGIKALLAQIEGWNVVGEAEDGVELLHLVEIHHPDLVILDLAMPHLGGLETLEQLSALKTKPQVLVLSANADERAAFEAIRSGARGFVQKSGTTQELVFAMQSILKGQKYLSPVVCAGVLESTGSCSERDVLSALSSRERQVMHLLCEGMPNREIARKLCISPRTVDTHRTNLLKKLGVSSNVELARLALQKGLTK